MDSAVLMLIFVASGPVIFFFITRARVAGKLLCWILEEDRSARQRLLKVKGNFIQMEQERYFVNPDSVRFVRYPASWPVWMQQTVPCSLYKRGEGNPLDWNTLAPIGPASAVELGTVLDPEWIKLVVKGTSEIGKTGGNRERLLLIIAIGASGLTLLLTFYLVSKMGAIESIVRSMGG